MARRVGGVSKVENARRNKLKKQQQAHSTLAEARERGLEALVTAVVTGNQHVRQVVTGDFLQPKATQFCLQHPEVILLAEVRKVIDKMHPDSQEMLKRELRRGDTSLQRVLGNARWAESLQWTMHDLVEKAAKRGDISPEEHAEIQQNKAQ